MAGSPTGQRATPNGHGRWRAVLIGVVVVLGVAGCGQSAPSADLGSWVRSPYVTAQRNAAAAAFGAWLSALRHAGLIPQARATEDGCGQYVDGGGAEPVSDWGVTCSRQVAVTVVAPQGVQAAQASLVRALTKAGWTRWHGSLAIPVGCSGDDLHGIHAQAQMPAVGATAVLSAWRLTCAAAGQPGAATYGRTASGCYAGPMVGWVAWSWAERVCRPIGLISREAARSRIQIALFVTYVAADRGTSTDTNPPPLTG
jgi:hypothetical protein